jgi:hypothetical protein
MPWPTVRAATTDDERRRAICTARRGSIRQVRKGDRNMHTDFTELPAAAILSGIAILALVTLICSFR